MHTLDVSYHGHTYRIHLRPPRRNYHYLRLSVDGCGVLNLDWIAAQAEAEETQLPPPYADSSEQQRPGTTYRLALRADASARIQIVSDSLTTTPADDATLPRVSVPSIVHKAALIAYQRRYRL